MVPVRRRPKESVRELPDRGVLSFATFRNWFFITSIFRTGSGRSSGSCVLVAVELHHLVRAFKVFCSGPPNASRRFFFLFPNSL